jgi:ATP-dependent Clp protease ATP-binding subunit ClpX
MTGREGEQHEGPPPTFCDFCGQTTMKVGPMVEGNALVQSGVRAQNSHICSECVKA